MARWEVTFALDRRQDVPLFQQIGRAITADIRRGRLRPGDALPGTRTLARALGVQRLTVVTAFEDLVAEGWIVNERARGAFVSTDLPDPLPNRNGRTTSRAAACCSRRAVRTCVSPPAWRSAARFGAP
jgi:GntR family transcriptional regulator/MocR family aminotransferase